MCHVSLRESSAVKFDRAEIAFTLALFHRQKPLADEGGEETEVLEKNPDDAFQKMPHTGAHKIRTQSRVEPALSSIACRRCWASRHALHHIFSSYSTGVSYHMMDSETNDV